MADLPFNQDWIENIADNRISFLTTIFLVFTFLGATEGYILLIVGIYWLKDKKIGFEITMVAIFSAFSNAILKLIIQNPRPFVKDGTYEDKWAIAESDMEDTSLEYSTPSGHAMGSATFWSYLYNKFQSRSTLLLATVMILMVGLSRPYLGVHYFEDIILGWMLGLFVTFIILKNENSISNWWSSYSNSLKISIIMAVSIVPWIIGGLINDPTWGFDVQPLATFGGFFAGIVLGYMSEGEKIGFSPEFKSPVTAIMRYLLGVILVFVTLIGLDGIFAEISDDDSFLGFLLRYIRYFMVAFVASFIVPLLFVKLKLADYELK